MREIEKIINNPTAYNTTIYVDGFNCTVKQLIKQAYNLGLQDAADNVETKQLKYTTDIVVDKESILKLKI